jgi:serine protease Do
MWNKRVLLTVALSIVGMCLGTLRAAQQGDSQDQTAIRQAVAAVAPSVVQIATVGGLDRVANTQLAPGPTSGLIVSADGLIVSSAFNFAHHPSSILVRLADGRQLPATLVARDTNRMLVLLKVEGEKKLPLPVAAPWKEMAVGQTAFALGRTFQADSVDVSLGIVSALGRMNGRVLQTDANISAANYGGPLVDLRGRVLGVLVPMAPQQDSEADNDEVAGSEFYDSGIGFAVPLETILTLLDRWQSEGDLRPGRMGVTFGKGSAYVEPPRIAVVWPGSPADKASWRSGDTILAIDGHFVETQSQLQFLIKPRYAGDKLAVTLRRGTDEMSEEFDSEITLAGDMPTYRAPFLGVLPALVQQEGGVTVGGVWPVSPAAKAGLRSGDRITKLGDTATPTLDEAVAALRAMQVGQQVTVTVERDKQELQLAATLSGLPEAIPATGDLPTFESDQPLSLEELKLPQFPQIAHYFRPKQAAEVAPGLLLLLVDSGNQQDQAAAEAWRGVCERGPLVLLLARPASDAGWQTDDLEYLDQLVGHAKKQFSVDPMRTVVVGQEKAGQLAYALALRRQQTFSGVVADNAPLPRTLKLPETSPTQHVAVLSLVPHNTPFAPLLKQDITSLREAGYPVSTLERTASRSTSVEMDAATRSAVERWITGLRRL